MSNFPIFHSYIVKYLHLHSCFNCEQEQSSYTLSIVCYSETNYNLIQIEICTVIGEF